MAGNKHALTRYRVLDACFSNWMRKYYAEDLIAKCNEALAERYPSGDVGISRRTFFDDLNDLDEIVGGYGVEIKRLNDGRKKYYRYDKENFSLFAKGFTEEELQALKENIQTLQRFKGLPTFSWMDSLVSKLEDTLSIKSSVDNILAYEENAGYSGIDWLKDCFDAIINKQPIQVDYRTFDEKEFTWTIHPYYIKQYNNRWFLIGHNPEFNRLSHIPLDRIDEIEPLHIDYIPNANTDFEQYFDNVIGTTIANAPVQDIKLRFSQKRLQYVLTKPIHKSQKCSDPETGIVFLKLIPNRELEALILSFGPDVEVLEPQSLREQVRERIRESFSHYFDVQTSRTTMSQICTVNTD
jgi:predicted DNA-binding transcriptional regulator YafY